MRKPRPRSREENPPPDEFREAVKKILLIHHAGRAERIFSRVQEISTRVFIRMARDNGNTPEETAAMLVELDAKMQASNSNIPDVH